MDTTKRFAALILNIAHTNKQKNRLRANEHGKKRSGIENQSFNEIYNGSG